MKRYPSGGRCRCVVTFDDRLPDPSTAPLIIIESIHADEIERRVAALDGYTVQSAQALPETATRAITYIVFMVRK